MASRRNYATKADCLAFDAGLVFADDADADKQISRAEEMIDQYVGFQKKFLENEPRVEINQVSDDGKTLFDTFGGSQLFQTDDYYKYCEIEILGGTGVGQHNFIIASNRDAKSITVRDGWTVTPDDTSIGVIRQVAKFPNAKNAFTNRTGTLWVKEYPSQLSDAVCAQVQFMQAKGVEYFSSDGPDMDSENIGNYGYSKGRTISPTAFISLIAPSARQLLQGIMNRTGVIEVDDDGC